MKPIVFVVIAELGMRASVCSVLEAEGHVAFPVAEDEITQVVEVCPELRGSAIVRSMQQAFSLGAAPYAANSATSMSA